MFIAKVYAFHDDEYAGDDYAYYTDIILVHGSTYSEAMEHVISFYGKELLKVTMIDLADNSEVFVLSDDDCLGIEEARNLFNRIDESL